MKVLLLGDTGSLGRQFKSFFLKKKIKVVSINRKKNNIKFNPNSIKKIVKKNKPNIIINCIALTGLIYCQRKKKEAFEANTNIPLRILSTIKKTKIKLIHFSTDAVFKGKKVNKIYGEKDKAYPGTIYGKSKYSADKKILKAKNTLVIRLPLLFGPTHSGQIVSKLLKSVKKGNKIFVADDVYSTPVYTPELCSFVYQNCFKKDKIFSKKLIHFTSSRRLSMYKLIYELSKNIKGINLNKIIKVKDSYFKTGIKIKPKNLGLTSEYKSCIKKINFTVGKHII
tara:strand:- start:39126 stop:39971 length:846 start_codon:yes stop_codon:yes gene_type:complete